VRCDRASVLDDSDICCLVFYHFVCANPVNEGV
jgi:hypothetical protein